MARPPKLTIEQINEIKELSEQGLSSVVLGKQFDCDHTTILYQLGRLKRNPINKLSENASDKKHRYFYYKTGKPTGTTALPKKTRREILFKANYGKYPNSGELRQFNENYVGKIHFSIQGERVKKQ